MDKARQKKDISYPALFVIIVGSLIGLYFLGHFDPVPERREDTSGGLFLYYGPEGETVPETGIADTTRREAEAVLAEADYFGAYATGPGGQTGVWTGAHTPELARDFALADCGPGCRVVAERLPRHRDPSRTEPVATRAMAENLAVRKYFIHDYVALGGAGAWGHRAKPGGRSGRARAMRSAGEACEMRRAAEDAPDPALSLPCTVQRIEDFVDLRPKPTLYPAAYTIALTELAPASETRLVDVPGVEVGGWLAPLKPRLLYGARAANDGRSYEKVEAAGWPEAGDAIALLKCNASRRPGEGPCVVTHRRVPDPPVPSGRLAVRPDLYKSYRAWQETGGAGAFAVSPFGVWGSSYNHEDLDAAIQGAADWCWYYTRRNWEYRQVDRAFLDPGLGCRIVAIREG